MTEEYDKLIKEAKDISPGSSNLLFSPFLGGSFTPPDDVVRGTWLGLDYITLNRADHVCLGTALVAGLAVDMITDIRENLKKYFEIERRYFSDSIRHKKYERMARSYVRFKSDMINKIYNGFH